MIDFHTHILPFMDDGSDSIETSLKMLKKIENDGVEMVCLTPHYYSFSESIDKFVERREESFKKLHYKGKLKLKLGAEVRFYPSMSEDKNIDKLCLEGTNILLVELPLLKTIKDDVIYEILRLNNKGYDVVLAHIERYRIKKQTMDYLYKSGIKFQLNTEVISNFFSRRRALELIKKHYITYLGSDCHNLKDRPPYYKSALFKLKTVLDDDLFFYINGVRDFVS